MNDFSIKKTMVQQTLAFTGNAEASKRNQPNTLIKLDAAPISFTDFQEIEMKNAYIVGKYGNMLENTEENQLFLSLNEIAWDFSAGFAYTDRTPDMNVWDKMAAEYSKLRDKINEIYSGDKRDDMLSALDARYDEQVESIADTMEMEIRMAESRHGFMLRVSAYKAKAAAGQQGFLTLSDKENSQIDMQIAPYKELAQMIRESLIQMGKNTKEFILAGNKAPVTDEEKAYFYQNISDGAKLDFETVGVVADYTKAMSNGVFSEEKLKNAVSNVINSSLSNSVIALLTNAAATKLTIFESPYAKTANALETQLNDALRERKANKASSLAISYVDELNNARIQNNNIKSIEEQLVEVYSKALSINDNTKA